MEIKEQPQVIGGSQEQDIYYADTVFGVTGEDAKNTVIRSVDYRGWTHKAGDAIVVPDNFDKSIFDQIEIMPIFASTESKMMSGNRFTRIEVEGQEYMIAMIKGVANSWILYLQDDVGSKTQFVVEENKTVFIRNFPFHTASIISNKETSEVQILINKVKSTNGNEINCELPDMLTPEDVLKALQKEFTGITMEEINYIQDSFRYVSGSRIENPRNSIFTTPNSHSEEAAFLYSQMRNYINRVKLFGFVNNQVYETNNERIKADIIGLTKLRYEFENKLRRFSESEEYVLQTHEIPKIDSVNLKTVSKDTASLVDGHYTLGYVSMKVANLVVDNVIERGLELETEVSPNFRWYFLTELAFHEIVHTESANPKCKYEELFCRYVSEELTNTHEEYKNISEFVKYKELSIFQTEVVDGLIKIIKENEIYWEQIFDHPDFKPLRSYCEQLIGKGRITPPELMRQIVLATIYRVDRLVDVKEFIHEDPSVKTLILGVASLFEAIHATVGIEVSFDDLFNVKDYDDLAVHYSTTTPGNTADRFMMELHNRIVKQF